MTTAQDIRDDLVAHDIDMRRVDGHVRRQVEQRIDELIADLKGLAIKIDPNGAARNDTKDRRVKQLEVESRILVKAAFAEIRKLTNEALNRVARTESHKVVDVITENLP